MTDNELKDECLENAEIDLRRYSNKELTQIREAMRIYADCKLKLFAIPDVVGRSEQLNCDHEWKVEAFDCYGIPYEQYCEHCGKKEAI